MSSADMPLSGALQVGMRFPFPMAVTYGTLTAQYVEGIFYQNNF